MQTQVRLLRVLETGEFIKMGSSQVQKTNVRVVAATNLDIPKAISEGRFREDLYYRLNSVEIKVPSLRERREDIPLLFRKFAADFAEKYRMPTIRLDEEATQLIQSYYWNGNIRQLKNVAEQISVMETNHEINADTLRKYLPENGLHHAIQLARPQNSNGDEFMNERELLYKVLLDMKRDMSEMRQQLNGLLANKPVSAPVQPVQQEEYQTVEVLHDEAPTNIATLERDSIRRALERNGGNRKLAADELGISERTLYRKIKDYGL